MICLLIHQITVLNNNSVPENKYILALYVSRLIYVGNNYNLLLCLKSNSTNNDDNILTQQFPGVDLKRPCEGQCYHPIVDDGERKY